MSCRADDWAEKTASAAASLAEASTKASWHSRRADAWMSGCHIGAGSTTDVAQGPTMAIAPMARDSGAAAASWHRRRAGVWMESLGSTSTPSTSVGSHAWLPNDYSISKCSTAVSSSDRPAGASFCAYERIALPVRVEGLTLEAKVALPSDCTYGKCDMGVCQSDRASGGAVANWPTFRSNRAAMYTIGAYLAEESMRGSGAITTHVAPVLPALLQAHPPARAEAPSVSIPAEQSNTLTDEFNALAFAAEAQTRCQDYIMQDVYSEAAVVLPAAVM